MEVILEDLVQQIVTDWVSICPIANFLHSLHTPHQFRFFLKF